MKGKILFVVTSCAELGDSGEKTGFDLTEVAHPYYVARDAGYAIEFVSPNGGTAPLDPSSRDRDDPRGAQFLDDPTAQEQIKHTRRPEDIDAREYDAIYFAGGHGTMWDFPKSTALHKLAADIYEHGGVVAAVCHGPAALLGVRLSSGEYLVDGRRVSAFTNEEERKAEKEDVVPFMLQTELEKLGANHHKSPPFEEHVEVDGRLVTGQNPASAQRLGEELISLLGHGGTQSDAAE